MLILQSKYYVPYKYTYVYMLIPLFDDTACTTDGSYIHRYTYKHTYTFAMREQ